MINNRCVQMTTAKEMCDHDCDSLLGHCVPHRMSVSEPLSDMGNECYLQIYSLSVFTETSMTTQHRIMSSCLECLSAMTEFSTFLMLLKTF